MAQPRGAEDCLDVQFFQNEPEIALNEPKIAANEPEFMVDSVEPLVHRPELGVNRHKLGVDSRESRVAGIEPLVLSGESCVHLGKPAGRISSACSRKCSSRVLPPIDPSRSATRSSSDFFAMSRDTAGSMPAAYAAVRPRRNSWDCGEQRRDDGSIVIRGKTTGQMLATAASAAPMFCGAANLSGL